jgi:hypothetical protein
MLSPPRWISASLLLTTTFMAHSCAQEDIALTPYVKLKYVQLGVIEKLATVCALGDHCSGQQNFGICSCRQANKTDEFWAPQLQVLGQFQHDVGPAPLQLVTHSSFARLVGNPE